MWGVYEAPSPVAMKTPCGGIPPRGDLDCGCPLNSRSYFTMFGRFFQWEAVVGAISRSRLFMRPQRTQQRSKGTAYHAGGWEW